MGVPPKGWLIKDNPVQMDENWWYLYFRKPAYCRICILIICIMWQMVNPIVCAIP